MMKQLSLMVHELENAKGSSSTGVLWRGGEIPSRVENEGLRREVVSNPPQPRGLAGLLGVITFFIVICKYT